MLSTNYVSTLILVSPDCAAKLGAVPPKPGTIGAIQHEMLSASPYQMTSDDLLVAVEARRKDVTGRKLSEFREAFFSGPQACLRSWPLVKSYGWGFITMPVVRSRWWVGRQNNTRHSLKIRRSRKS